MLGIETTTAIPRSVKLRPDDVNTQVIVQLGELYKDSQAELFLQPIEGLQPYGTEKNAKIGNLAITFLRNTLGIPRCLKT
jgi:hypothetical protein